MKTFSSVGIKRTGESIHVRDKAEVSLYITAEVMKYTFHLN